MSNILKYSSSALFAISKFSSLIPLARNRDRRIQDTKRAHTDAKARIVPIQNTVGIDIANVVSIQHITYWILVFLQERVIYLISCTNSVRLSLVEELIRFACKLYRIKLNNLLHSVIAFVCNWNLAFWFCGVYVLNEFASNRLQWMFSEYSCSLSDNRRNLFG